MQSKNFSGWYINTIYNLYTKSKGVIILETNANSRQEAEAVVMNLDRELISRFGNAVFQCPETVSIIMRVDFKDGSSVGFQRDKEIE